MMVKSRFKFLEEMLLSIELHHATWAEWLMISLLCRCVVGSPSSGGGVGQAMMANGGLPGKASSGGGGKNYLDYLYDFMNYWNGNDGQWRAASKGFKWWRWNRSMIIIVKMMVILALRIMKMRIMEMMANGGMPGKASSGGGGGKDYCHNQYLYLCP